MRMRAPGPGEMEMCRGRLDALKIRARLDRKVWGPPTPWGEAWMFQARDGRCVIASYWPADIDLDGEFDCDWLHASISGAMGTMPSYEDLKLLHRAVFVEGHAYQVFVPTTEHINLKENVLHLWGHADGSPALPNFGGFGSI
jgi:hypothetical protein